MRNWYVLMLGLLAAGAIWLNAAVYDGSSKAARVGGDVRKLSDGELARSLGGTAYPCCARYTGTGPGPGGQCASVAPTPAPIAGGPAGCVVGPNGDGCAQNIAGKECAYDKTLGPNRPDVCTSAQSNNAADICNPVINGWCEAYNRRVCTATVNGCECKDFGGATTGTRGTCNYTNALGVPSKICPGT